MPPMRTDESLRFWIDHLGNTTLTFASLSDAAMVPRTEADRGALDPISKVGTADRAGPVAP